jgi:Sulfotransferase family
VLSGWAEQQGKSRWGEKSPNHIFWWPFIENSFPQATVIHIVRDGRDVALSLIKAPFGPKTIATAAEHWIKFVEVARAIGSRVGPSRYVEVRYEELLLHPTETVTQVLDIIGQPFDPAVLHFHVDARPVDTDPVNNANIRRPILADNAHKWATQLTNRQVEVFEAIAGKTLEACGYARSTTKSSMSPIERAARRYIARIGPKALAMIRNHAGIAEGLQREALRLRLMTHRLWDS